MNDMLEVQTVLSSATNKSNRMILCRCMVFMHKHNRDWHYSFSVCLIFLSSDSKTGGATEQKLRGAIKVPYCITLLYDKVCPLLKLPFMDYTKENSMLVFSSTKNSKRTELTTYNHIYEIYKYKYTYMYKPHIWNIYIYV